MKVHRYSEHQRRLWVYQMVNKTKSIKAICSEALISRATLYNWLSEFNEEANGDNLPVKKETETAVSLSWQPNDKYKMLLSVLVKTDADKTISRRLARELVKRYNLTIAQACAMVNMPEEVYGYRPRKPEADDKEVYAALMHLLEENNSRSLEDCIAVLQPMHSDWTVKQIKRIYRQGRLYLKRTRVRRMLSLPPEIILPQDDIAVSVRLKREGAFWHIGMIQEENVWLLFCLDYNDGTPLNIMTGDGSMIETQVMQLVIKAAMANGLPKKIRIPAGAPFSSRELSKWSWENRVAVHHLSLAKPENVLEADYIQDDIKRQLGIGNHTMPEELQATAENWIRGFVQNSREVVNYFVKETAAD